MIRRVTGLVLVLALIFTTINIGSVSYGKSTEFTLDDNARFYIVSVASPDDEILETVKLLDSQFAASGIPSSNPMTIAYGSSSRIANGDIAIIIDETIGEQGYEITTTGANIYVKAGDSAGLMYGIDTLMQKFMIKGNTVSVNIKSSPDTSERTVLLDCGRKYYSRQWIENFIKRMSWQKYTSLELHFSDTHGMRFESTKYPWINEPEGEYLTRDDLKSICETARKYNVEIIPELDSPGHLDYVIEKYAEHVANNPDFTFEYDGVTYSADDEGFSNISNYYMYNGSKSAYNNTGIDLSSPVAVAFISSLIDEYADFFAGEGCTKFNIGGDELFGWKGVTVGGRHFNMNELWSAMAHWEKYARDTLDIENGSAADTFISYLNSTGKRLAEKGYTCRVWNDEMYRASDQHVDLDPSIEIVYWTNDYTPMAELAQKGYSIHNTNTGWCYYVIRRDKNGGDIMDKTRRRCNAKNIYENWNPRNCANPTDSETLIPEETYAGGYFAIWADNPDFKTESQVWEDTEYRTWANSYKLWSFDINESVGYDQFKAYVSQINDFPGYSGDCEVDSELPESAGIEADLTLLDRIKNLFNMN